jgi:hypothetical protein
MTVFSPERRAKRKARRSARKKARKGEPLTAVEQEILMAEVVKVTLPDGRTVERTEPTIKKRTSTKVLGAAGAGFAASLVTLVPFYDEINGLLLEACQSEQGPTVFLAGFVVATGIAYTTARFTKSPILPGKL